MVMRDRLSDPGLYKMKNGKKEKNFIPLSEPYFSGNEWKYIKECIDTGWVSSVGKYVNRFEEEIQKFTGSKYAVSCVNGTSALQVSLRIVGVTFDDEVIVPTLTFIAPINAVGYLGAKPIFMDCDEFYNINIEKTLEFIKNESLFRNGHTYNKKTQKRISAIIPVHVFGNAVYLEELVAICSERNIKIVEDAAESLGTLYKEGKFKRKHTGNVGDIGCLSFNGNKIITTGGGGMIITDSREYAQKARYLTTQAKEEGVDYIHNEIGYNFRLTNIQSALGIAQLEKLYDYKKEKKKNYQVYKKEIDKISGLHLAELPDYAENNHWMYALQIDKKIYGKDREELMNHLLKSKIHTRPVWYLNHLQKPYQYCQQYKIEKALKLLDITLNLPCSVNLTENQISKVIGGL
jgi:aminotransferase in exopolysaccharide biosynthesis